MFMNKPVYLGFSTLELSKTRFYEFWYDHVKPKYGEQTKLCYTDTYSFIVYIIGDNIYKDIEKDVETKFDPSNYELDRPLRKEKSKKIIGFMVDELGENIMKEFVELRAKTYSYLIDHSSGHKKR